MRHLLLVIGSFAITIFAWGLYGPVLHWGQAAMVTAAGHAQGEKYALLRPFVCVGLAYFAIGVIVPAVLLKLQGEQGAWTFTGTLTSLLSGALGAIGALGILLAFHFGGKPIFVMPLVFGGAPVVNAFLTIYWSKQLKAIGPLFLTGLVMVLLGAVTVLVNKPKSAAPPAATEVTVGTANKAADDSAVNSTVNSTLGATVDANVVEPETHKLHDFFFRLASILTTIVCWGAYGPLLHKGQAAMHQSRLRPLLCVGLAYFAIAVLVPNVLLATSLPEASHYNFTGTAWSLAAGAAGAIGALGIILAFHFGGKPIFVMPLVFGGAPVVNTLFTTFTGGLWGEVNALFFAGLILVIAGAAMVLVFAPKGTPPRTPAPGA
jgi:hypothetical protein